MTEQHSKHAVVLLSGGLDSATALAIARAEGFLCHTLSFDYGQRHRGELECARAVATIGGAVDSNLVTIDLSVRAGFGGSALTDEIDVPKDRLKGKDDKGIPVTYVPARNTIFLSMALGYAEIIGAFDIFIGVNAVDYSGYPDCRPEFIKAFEKLANVATAAGVGGKDSFRIHAPLIKLSKAQIIRKGLELGVEYSLTRSCYDPTPDGFSCGRCDACILRLRGFEEAGAKDPVPYVR